MGIGETGDIGQVAQNPVGMEDIREKESVTTQLHITEEMTAMGLTQMRRAVMNKIAPIAQVDGYFMEETRNVID